MKHPIVILSSGKTVVFDPIVSWNNLPLSALYDEIKRWELKSTTYIMNKRDYDDIVAWGNSGNQ